MGDPQYLSHVALALQNLVPPMFNLYNADLVSELQAAQRIVNQYVNNQNIASGQPAHLLFDVANSTGRRPARFSEQYAPRFNGEHEPRRQFHAGGPADAYTITVANVGSAATSGSVTVSDTLPAGLARTRADSGTINGWSVSTSGQTVTATRSGVLGIGASYPALTVTVSVASNAPASVTNTATVAGGGESNTANDTASDPTTINGAAPSAELVSSSISDQSGQILVTDTDPRARRTLRSLGEIGGVALARDILYIIV